MPPCPPESFAFCPDAQSVLAGACLCMDVRKAARVLGRLYDEALAPHRLTVGQFGLLGTIQLHEGRSLQAVADRICLDQSALSRALRPLEKAGLVEGRLDEADRRRRVLHLTSEGRRRFNAAAASWRDVQDRIAARYGAAQIEALQADLRRLVAAM